MPFPLSAGLLDNTNIPSDALLLTIDVSNLYLNIPQDEGTEASLNALEKANNLPMPQELTKQLFDFVLKENVFTFGEKAFKQVRGTAMGTKMAPSYANIFMEPNFLQHQLVKPLLWKRYIKDIFLIWKGNQTQLDTFLKYLNLFHPTIKFTSESSTSTVNFTIYKGTRFKSSHKLDYKMHFKPTNTFQYLHHQSSYTTSTKKAVIIGEAKRFKRTNSDTETYNKTIQQFKHHLSLRGYPPDFIEHTLQKTNIANRNPKPTQNTHPLVLVTSYSSATKSLHTKLKEHWHLVPQPLKNLSISSLSHFQMIKNRWQHSNESKTPRKPTNR